jgi:thiol-disulfide isomerase/thioredoxin
MSARWLFSLVGVLALLAGTAMWLGNRPPVAGVSAPEISPAAFYAATFADAHGRPQSVGQFQGRTLVVNFWATWCAPCREEMPAFTRLQSRWAGRNVQFVGLANDDPGKVERFGRELGITYPLWTGGDEVGEMSRRLGNRLGVLPHTVILDPQGRVLEERVGPYTEKELDQRLEQVTRNAR